MHTNTETRETQANVWWPSRGQWCQLELIGSASCQCNSSPPPGHPWRRVIGPVIVSISFFSVGSPQCSSSHLSLTSTEAHLLTVSRLLTNLHLPVSERRPDTFFFFPTSLLFPAQQHSPCSRRPGTCGFYLQPINWPLLGPTTAAILNMRNRTAVRPSGRRPTTNRLPNCGSK